MTERRDKRRRVLSAHFNCYLDGERFDSESLDVSSHGALLITRARVPVGKRILVVPKGQPDLPAGRAASDDPIASLPVLLSALVVRWHDSPVGLGITWVSGISHVGVDPLLIVIQYILGRSAATLTPPEIEVFTKQDVSYDFIEERFRLISAPEYLSDSVGADATTVEDGDARDAEPIQGPITHPIHPPPWLQQTEEAELNEFAPLPTSHGFESSATAAQLTDLLSSGPAQVRVMKAVQARIGERDRRAIVHDIGLTSLLLIVPGEEIPGVERLAVVFPVPYRKEKLKLLLRCTVTKVIRLVKQGATGYRLAILAVDREAVPGLYTRYVKYLFEQDLFKNE